MHVYVSVYWAKIIMSKSINVLLIEVPRLQESRNQEAVVCDLVSLLALSKQTLAATGD